MPVLIDLDNATLAAGVGDLIAEPARRTIGLSGGRARLWLGTELHRRVQRRLAREEPGFRSEVPVRRELVVDGWRVTITGRADGVVERGGMVQRVDEIKTIQLTPERTLDVRPDELERYRDQVRLYAHLLGAGDDHPNARLILVDVLTGEERIEPVPWSHQAAEDLIRSSVGRLVGAERDRRERLTDARARAEYLPFPHAEWRPEQMPMIDATENALSADRPLLINAPTGSGKTAAVLHTALRWSLARGERLYYLTSKTMQQRIAVDTLVRMDGGVRSLQMRAKSKMCAHKEMICHEACCPYAEGYADKLEQRRVLETIRANGPHLSPDRIFDVAAAAEVCPFEVSLDLLTSVDTVVCDYNYVFDPVLGLEAVTGEGSQRTVLIVDEAHNLIDRGRSYYSPRLEVGLVDAALTHLRGLDSDALDPLEETFEALHDLIVTTVDDTLEGAEQGEAFAELDLDALGRLRARADMAMVRYVLLKRRWELWLADDPAVEAHRALNRFQQVAELGGDELVPLAGRGGPGGDVLRIVCVDASRFLGPQLEAAAGAVGMSATLQPFDYSCDMLGLSRGGTDTLTVPSPFPSENRLVLAITDVDTRYRRRTASADRVAEWIVRLAAPGRNALVLLPSYAYLRMILDRLPPTDHTVLVQRSGAPDGENLDRLASLQNGTGHLLFAVLGGMFAEGVDYPGEMLSQVMIVSPGLPQVSSDRGLLRDFFQLRYGSGFRYAYLIPGMTRVVQAAGRLIRSADDRGVIALIGRRFLQPGYAELLPEDWTGGNPEALLWADPEAAVRDFFAGRSHDGR